MQIVFYIKSIIGTIISIIAFIIIMTFAIFQLIGIVMCGADFTLINNKHNKIDVVSRTGSCGATTSYSNNLYLTENNKDIEIYHKNNSFLNINDNKILLEWLDDKTLVVKINKDAKVFKYTNTVYHDNIRYHIILRYFEVENE